MATTSSLQWFKSSYSGGSGTECVECASADQVTLVRDSKRPNGAFIPLHGRAWAAFVGAVSSMPVPDEVNR